MLRSRRGRKYFGKSGEIRTRVMSILLHKIADSQMERVRGKKSPKARKEVSGRKAGAPEGTERFCLSTAHAGNRNTRK